MGPTIFNFRMKKKMVFSIKTMHQHMIFHFADKNEQIYFYNEQNFLLAAFQPSRCPTVLIGHPLPATFPQECSTYLTFGLP